MSSSLDNKKNIDNLEHKLYQVTIMINPEAEEAVVDFLYSCSPESVSVETGPELAYCIKSFFKNNPEIINAKLRRYIDGLNEFGLAPGNYSIETEELREEDWQNSWKKFYRPLEIGKTILILPAWLDEPVNNQRTILKLDPGMAFGTGQHPTTCLCLEMAEDYLKPAMTVLDVGCGSGVLSIYAALIGCDEVVGLDNDSSITSVPSRNETLNDLKYRVRWLIGELDAIKKKDFDFLFMNITIDIITKIGEKALNLLKHDGVCLFSGIISPDREKAISFIESNGLKILEIREKEEWLGIVGLKNA